jgi:tetratricopeptide (TPR) repeat protein
VHHCEAHTCVSLWESMVMTLEPDDAFRLQSAEGWLELGLHVEAKKELENVSPELKAYPPVLRLGWAISIAARQWEAACQSATTLTQVAPEDAVGWIGRSYALHEMKRTKEARDGLLPVLDDFPVNAIMRYNVACYECCLGRLDQAKVWLEKAFAVGDPIEIRRSALDDPDLEPLWEQIKNM